MNPEIINIIEGNRTKTTTPIFRKIQEKNHPPYQMGEMIKIIQTMMMDIQQLKNHQNQIAKN